jgi:hypothetical protein
MTNSEKWKIAGVFILFSAFCLLLFTINWYSKHDPYYIIKPYRSFSPCAAGTGIQP